MRAWIVPVAGKFQIQHEVTDHPSKAWMADGSRFHSWEAAWRRAFALGFSVQEESECPLPRVTQADVNLVQWGARVAGKKMEIPVVDIREDAIRYTMGVLRRAMDWQDGQTALGDHDRFRPWLDESGDPIAEAQSIIREAEERLGDELPY